MDRRSPGAVVAANVALASGSRGAASVMDAAGVPTDRPELTWGDLLDISGVLSVSPAVFFEGVASA